MVELRRDNELKPGTWKPVYVDMKRTAKLACPGCGNAAVLDHEIAPDGTVTPSVECPFEPCTFHDDVKLLGWVEVVH